MSETKDTAKAFDERIEALVDAHIIELQKTSTAFTAALKDAADDYDGVIPDHIALAIIHHHGKRLEKALSD